MQFVICFCSLREIAILIRKYLLDSFNLTRIYKLEIILRRLDLKLSHRCKKCTDKILT